MSEPEISHRCSSCGASHRGHALFCPQCGAPLARPGETSQAKESVGAATSNVEVNKSDAPKPDGMKAPGAEASVPQRRRTDRGDDTPAQRAPTNQSANSARGPVKAGKKSHSRDGRADAGSPPSRGDKARRNIQRATTAARDALGDNVRPRVEKIRHASSVVLEEASDDPSLRFILVAGLLFLLFVVLLVISKAI